MKSKGVDGRLTGSKCLPKLKGHPHEMSPHKSKLPSSVVIGHSPMKKAAVFKTGKSG